MHKLRTIHLFAGCGGGILADLLLGHQPVCAVEIDPYCQQVLHERQQDGILPWFPIFADVKEFDGKPWRGLVDVICAGFPCKGVSPARTNNHANGKLVGIHGGSSELWSEIPRIAVEAGHPDLLIENSRNLLTKGLNIIVQTLDAIGYECKWCVLGTGHFGADHERVRLWLKASHPNSPQFKRGGIPGRIHTQDADPCRPDWWKNKPGMERVANGIPDQMDRLKSIGNSQCPVVAATAFTILSTG